MIQAGEQLVKVLEDERARGRGVGLVPTMGALHRGHLALIERAVRENDVVVVTVFVNPLQFDRPDDLRGYPRDLDADAARADRAGVAYLFAPEEREMYPGVPEVTVTVRGSLGSELEAAGRPGHLDGVATVVTKLFALAGPCRAYFGEKDFQQLAVVRRVGSDLSLPVLVVGCPTVREWDGLACSSRNSRLSPPERAAAAVLHRALQAGRRMVLAGEDRPERVSDVIAGVVGSEALVSLEYVAAVDPASLAQPTVLHGEVRLLVAATVGPVRLIDNIGVVAA